MYFFFSKSKPKRIPLKYFDKRYIGYRTVKICINLDFLKKIDLLCFALRRQSYSVPRGLGGPCVDRSSWRRKWNAMFTICALWFICISRIAFVKCIMYTTFKIHGPYSEKLSFSVFSTSNIHFQKKSKKIGPSIFQREFDSLCEMCLRAIVFELFQNTDTHSYFSKVDMYIVMWSGLNKTFKIYLPKWQADFDFYQPH